MGFLKNCKVFCELEYKKSSILIHLLQCIREAVSSQNTINMTGSSLQEGSKDLKSSQGAKYAQFV